MPLNPDTASPEARERYARFWGQLPPTSEQRAAERAKLYEGAPVYQGLESYEGRVISKFLPRPGESPISFTKRLELAGLRNLTETLPPAELKAVSDAYNQAVRATEGDERSHDALRQQLDQRVGGEQVGIFGQDQPHRPVAAAPGVPMSTAAAMQVIREREETQRNQPPVHQDVSSLRSSGAGILGIG